MPIQYRYKKDQRGIASIVIVLVLVIILALVSIGLSRLINRDVNQSVESQKSRIASYAAESGINQVVTDLKNKDPLVSTNTTSCNSPLRNSLNTATGLSGDN